MVAGARALQGDCYTPVPGRAGAAERMSSCGFCLKERGALHLTKQEILPFGQQSPGKLTQDPANIRKTRT